ncbi:MAG: hypothetical protein LIO92_03155 [Clostridiales bacterium]|nr:hypothetical protein [Clostridiales bacterium]
MKKWLLIKLKGSYTVEAAGVFAVVFLTLMFLFTQAFHLRGETVGEFELHEEIERERHLIANIGEEEISGEKEGMNWKIQITAPVFRPENSLRLWSLLEELE